MLSYLFQRHFDADEPVEPEKLFNKCYPNSKGSWKKTGKTLVYKAREALADYFTSETGRNQKIRVEIDKSKYRLIFTEVTGDSRDSFRIFWQSYYDTQMPSPSIILFTERLSFRHQHIHISDDLSGDLPDSSRLSALTGKERWDESYHSMLSGEVMAGLALIKKFHEKNIPLEYGTVRQYPVRDPLRDRHIILMGNGNTNPLIRELQEGLKFVLTGQGVKADGEAGYPLLDELEPQPGSKSSKINKYVVLTRLRERKKSCITVIAANHGRAAQGVVEDYITFEPNLEDLLTELGVDHRKSMPSHFQVVFRVAILKESGEATIEKVDPIDVDIRKG